MLNLRKLWQHLSRSEKRSAWQLLALMIIGMGLETLSVGLLIPAATFFLDQDFIKKYPMLMEFFGQNNKESFGNAIIFGLVFLFFVYLVKACFLAYLVSRQAKFTTNFQARMSATLYNGYIRLPYRFHLKRNSAELLRNITVHSNGLADVSQQLLILLSECLVIFGLTVLLIWFEPVGILAVGILITLASGLFYVFTKRSLEKWGLDFHEYQSLRFKYLQQSFNGVRELKLLGKENYFFEQFEEANQKLAFVGRKQVVLSAMPRLFLEVVAVGGLISLMLVVFLQGKPIEAVIATSAVFGAAAFRLTPSVGKVIVALQSLKFSHKTLLHMSRELRLLRKPKPESLDTSAKPLREYIRFEHVRFRHRKSKVDTLNIEDWLINCGDTIGIVGESGAGKSTMLSILMGLLNPSSGVIRVDGVDIRKNLKNWQRQIGYVPQNTFFTDNSLRENIAFGTPVNSIDEFSVKRAVSLANLDKFVRNSPDGLDTQVGESGSRLSGGERQRLAIARALYHWPSVLILDEATSSLDEENERAVIKAIENLVGELTIIIVSHRINALSACGSIFKLCDGALKSLGSYSAFVKSAKMSSKS